MKKLLFIFIIINLYLITANSIKNLNYLDYINLKEVNKIFEYENGLLVRDYTVKQINNDVIEIYVKWYNIKRECLFLKLEYKNDNIVSIINYVNDEDIDYLYYKYEKKLLIKEEYKWIELQFDIYQKKNEKITKNYILKYNYNQDKLTSIDVTGDYFNLKQIVYEYTENNLLQEKYIFNNGHIEISKIEYDPVNKNNYIVYNPKLLTEKYYKFEYKEILNNEYKIVEMNLYPSDKKEVEPYKRIYKYKNNKLIEHNILGAINYIIEYKKNEQ